MNANDKLAHHTCSDHIYKHLGNFYYTVGVKDLCTTFECYWFLDVIRSYQPQLTEEPFQSWHLKRNGYEMKVTCTDGNGRKLVQQEIEFSDFEPTEAKVWVCDSIALLPSEH